MITIEFGETVADFDGKPAISCVVKANDSKGVEMSGPMRISPDVPIGIILKLADDCARGTEAMAVFQGAG